MQSLYRTEMALLFKFRSCDIDEILFFVFTCTPERIVIRGLEETSQRSAREEILVRINQDQGSRRNTFEEPRVFVEWEDQEISTSCYCSTVSYFVCRTKSLMFEFKGRFTFGVYSLGPQISVPFG